MIWSVLKVSPAQFAEIKSKMPVKGKKARQTRDNFCYSEIEREMLTELNCLLELFEFATNFKQTKSQYLESIHKSIVNW